MDVSRLVLSGILGIVIAAGCGAYVVHGKDQLITAQQATITRYESRHKDIGRCPVDCSAQRMKLDAQDYFWIGAAAGFILGAIVDWVRQRCYPSRKC
jgi:hypothetical protein